MKRLLPEPIAARVVKVTMILATLAVLASCAVAPVIPATKGDENDPWIVRVIFKANSKCEIVDVKPKMNSCNSNTKDVCVRRTKFLKWKSEPDKVAFDVYFDPVKGGRKFHAPVGTGEKKVQIDANTPPSRYKYSILGSDGGCVAKDHTFDPHIRIAD